MVDLHRYITTNTKSNRIFNQKLHFINKHDRTSNNSNKTIYMCVIRVGARLGHFFVTRGTKKNMIRLNGGRGHRPEGTNT